jgi:Putative zinc-finger/WD40-like Beta Propeller Repeat
MSEPMTHERARRLAAVRIDQVLPPSDEAALDAHLAGCPECRAVADGYQADRLALRALPPVEPPRDLWARTSAALELEHARHPRSVRRGPRRWGPVAVLGGGFALVLAIVIVGPGLLAGSAPAAGLIALASGNGAPAPSEGPLVTPLAVPTSEVTWVVTKGSGGLALVTAKVDKVCPTGDEPDCAPLAGISRSLATLPTVPSSVVISPSNAGQAVAIGPAADKVGTTVFVMAVPTPAPSSAPSSVPSPVGSGGPAGSPTASALATPAAGQTSTPAATSRASAPTRSPGESPTAPSTAPVVSPPASGTPAPSAAATLAILSNVTLVGDEAAYSPDGQWFAFSARPAGTSTGPDIYIWQAGWPAARAVTTDHGSVFSGWIDGQILASRAVPVEPAASPSPGGSGSPEVSPRGIPVASPSPTAAAASPAPSSGASSNPASAAGQAAASPAGAAPLLATPAAYLIDPASGLANRIVGLDGWRPVVDPSGRWVAYWAGTLSFDAPSGMWLPLQGGLQVASWAVVSTAADGPTGAAAAHALPIDVKSDWDVRWDRTGEHLGVWVADPDNPGLGSLSLLTIDQASGLTSSAPPILLNETPALRGFALRDGQLVWATPPGQDGTGSHLSILAWTGADAGKTTVEPIDGGAVIVVP